MTAAGALRLVLPLCTLAAGVSASAGDRAYRVADIEDIRPGVGSSTPVPLTVWNDVLYFLASDGVYGLWRSDGTSAGTYRLKTILSDSQAPTLAAPVELDGALYFVVERSVGACCLDEWLSRELWKTDGTPGGTGLVRDIRPDGNAGVARDGSLVVVGGRLLFGADDGVGGTEPWISDGTSSGTVPLVDVLPGPLGSEPRSILAAPGGAAAWFRATDWQQGYELWRTDGSPAGTAMVQDIAPGVAPSLAGDPEPTLAGGLVLFFADDSASGQELWAVPLEAPGGVPDGGRYFDGPPLRIERLEDGRLRLSWSAAACGPEATDYAVYAGDLGAFTDHLPVTCSTAGALEAEVDPAAGDRFYLVVPQSPGFEGSYGKTGGGAERAASAAACRPRVIYDSCP